MSDYGRPPSPDQPPQRRAPQGRPPLAGDPAWPGAPEGPAWPADPPVGRQPPQTHPQQPYPRQSPYEQPPQGSAHQPPAYQHQQPSAYQQQPPAYQQQPPQAYRQPPQAYRQPPQAYQQPGGTPRPPQQAGYRVSSDQFRPPTSRTPLLLTAIVVAVVLAVVATGAFVAWRSDHPTAAPTPSTTTSVPIPSTSGNSIQFVSDTGSGTMKILDTRWTDQSLTVKIKLSCSKGQVQHGTFNFKAFDQGGTLYDSSIAGAPAPHMSEGTIYAGESVTGWLAFAVGRQDMTLLLISEYGEAITAFAIKG